MNKLDLKTRLTILVLLVFAFGSLTTLMHLGLLDRFESALYASVATWITPALTSKVVAITRLGDVSTTLGLLVLLLLIPKTRRPLGLPIATAAVASASVNSVLKLWIARSRPTLLRLVPETGYAFPSGHAMNSALIGTMLLLIAFRSFQSPVKRLLLSVSVAVYMLAIGFSRIYLGVHRGGDILAGWAAGAAVAIVVDTLWQARANKHTQNPHKNTPSL